MLWKLAFNGTMVEQAKCSEDVLKRCEETWSFEPNPPVYSSLQWWRLCLSVRQPFWGRRRFIWPKHKWLLKPFWREPFFFWFQFAKPFFCSSKLEWHISWCLNFLQENRKNDWFPVQEKQENQEKSYFNNFHYPNPS